MPWGAQSWRNSAISLTVAAVIGALLALIVAYAISPRLATKGPPTEPMALSLADLPDKPLIPMLDRAALQLASLDINVRGKIPVIVAVYRGLYGCRLELRSYQVGGAGKALVGTSTHRWTVGDIQYELIAFGMDSERFNPIAAAAEQQTRPNPDSAVIDRQLRSARTPSAPCKN
jgi:hypothetical protein